MKIHPWCRTFYAVPIPPLLTREEFVKAYLPQYAKEYESPTGIRMVKGANGRLHVQMSTRASHQAQVTKRENRINEVYAAYCADHAAAVKFDAKKSTHETLPS